MTFMGNRLPLRIGEPITVAFRSAKVAFFRGAKGDYGTLIDSPVLTRVALHASGLVATLLACSTTVLCLASARSKRPRR